MARSVRLDRQRVPPAAAAIALAAELKAAAEDARALPAVAARGGGVAALAPVEDLEVDGVAAGVDQPVFADAGAVVGVAQIVRVFRYGAVADDLQNPVRGAFDFDAAIF